MVGGQLYGNQLYGAIAGETGCVYVVGPLLGDRSDWDGGERGHNAPKAGWGPSCEFGNSRARAPLPGAPPPGDDAGARGGVACVTKFGLFFAEEMVFAVAIQ